MIDECLEATCCVTIVLLLSLGANVGPLQAYPGLSIALRYTGLFSLGVMLQPSTI